MGEFKYLNSRSSPPSRTSWSTARSLQIAEGPKKWLIRSVVVGILVCFSVFFLVVVALTNHQVSDIKRHVSQPEDRLERSDLMEREIRALKNQFGILVTAAIENKLHAMEKKVRSQTVSANDIVLVQDLKSDFDVLKRYAMNSAMALLEAQDMRHASIRQSQRIFPDSETALKKISNLQNLIYVGIVSFGCIIVAMSALWFHNYLYIKRLNYLLAHSPILLEKSNP